MKRFRDAYTGLFPSKAPFSRRNVLRGMLGGLGVSIGLPVLECMLDSTGEAFAQTGEPSVSPMFGVFFWAQGVHHDSFLPTQTGAAWDLPFAFSSFGGRYAHLRPYLSLLTGTSHRGSSPGHIPARGIVLSSSHDMRVYTGENTGTYRYHNHPEPSIDSIAAEAWEGKTPYSQLGVSISQCKQYPSSSSWRKGGAKLEYETNPVRLWDALFKAVPQTSDPQQLALLEQTAAQETSMLDAVKRDLIDLNQKIGAQDRIRIEQHLDGLREVEKRLQLRVEAAKSGGTQGPVPERPTRSYFNEGKDDEERDPKCAIMARLVAHALACGLTRVFSFEWSGTQSEAKYRDLGLTSLTHHGYAHEHARAKTPSAINAMKTITAHIMGQFAVLADALYQLPAPGGQGNLLDHALLLGTSEHANAGNHNYSDHPFVFIGKAGGRFKAGMHVRVSGRNFDAPRGLLTALHGVGVNVPRIGQEQSDGGNSRVATAPITGLLA